MLPSDFKPTVLRYKNLESTNVTARDLAKKGTGEGTVIVADSQTSGRGRGKRVWHSPVGGLYLSILTYPKDPRRATDLSFVAAVAMAQAVKQLLPKSADVSVKWPNDVLVGWKKVGGILSENLGEEYFHTCIVGMGLNVNLSLEELVPFQNNPFKATSFMMETQGVSDKDAVLEVLLNKFFTVYHLYHTEGFAPIQFLWEKNCSFINKKIELRESGWRESDPTTQARETGVTVGTFLGIDESGAMVLSNSKGERRTYFTGEITCFWP